MRNGEIVFHCVRTVDEDGVERFSKPTPIRLQPNFFTIQPAGGFMDNQAFGEFTDLTNKGVAIPYERWKNVFHTGDRFYLGVTPNGYKEDVEPEEGWGFDANAQVVSVKPQNRSIGLTLRNIVE